MATVPDFGSLAQQQADASNAAADRTNLANRSNQSGALGSSTWTLGPNGQWTNNVGLNGGAQGLFDTTISGQQNLAGQVGQGLNTSGLMDWGNTDLTRGAVGMPDSGFGASQQVIDAWNALQRPGLDQNNAAARNRAAAMGITLGSNAQNDVERNIGVNESEARNQGILRGTQEYQNVFNRGMASRQQTVAENTAQANLMNQMRGQQLGEREKALAAAQSGMTSLTGVRNSLNPNEWLGKTTASANYTAPQLYGAALDTFSSQQANENAARAQSNADRSANMGAINTGINAVNGLGGISGIASGAKSIWDMFGSGGGGGISDVYGYGNPTWGSDWGASSLGYSNAPVDYFGGSGGWGNIGGGSGYDTSGLGAWGGSGQLGLTNSWL